MGTGKLIKVKEKTKDKAIEKAKDKVPEKEKAVDKGKEKIPVKDVPIREGEIKVWDVESGNRLSGLSLSAEELATSAKKISGFMAKPGSAAVAAAVIEDSPQEPGASGPVYTKWWFWTAVGVVAVGGAATAAGVAASNNPNGRAFNVVLGIP